LTFGKKEEEIFLGREIAKHRDYSEKTAVEIDQEVHRIVTDAAERSHEIISGNVDKLHRLAEALLEREILDGDEIDRILSGQPLEEPLIKKAEEPKEIEVKAARTKKGIKDITPEGGEEPSPATA
jgi:cell division protease FtsH